jgi:ribose transport system ATP-binding protein
MGSSPAISIHEVSKRFGGVPALKSVSFDIPAGEVHALVGENGAGKSTLMKILAGVHRPDAGEIQLDGCPARLGSPRAAQDRGISIVFQELNLFPHRTVTANLFINRELTLLGGPLDLRAMRAAARSALAELGANIDPDALVGSLTIAEKQLVEIARTLLHRSRIIILDEPTSALNEAESRRLFEIIRRLRTQGVTILYISHRLEEVFAIADRISVLRDGKFQGSYAIAQTTIADVIHAMVGVRLTEIFPPRPAREASGRVVLSVEELRAAERLGPLSFNARQGEIVGFAGLEGSGLDDLFRSLFGLERVRAGSVRLLGQAVPLRHPGDAIRAGLALVPENRGEQGLMVDGSVASNASLVILEQLRNAFGLMSPGRLRGFVEKTIRELGIVTSSIQQPVRTLSGGNQQKVLLGKWLATKPTVLLLNNPTRGVDIGAKREIYVLCRKLAAEGMTILFASSEIDEVLGLADRILVLVNGKVRKEFAAETASQSALLHAMLEGGELKVEC